MLYCGEEIGTGDDPKVRFLGGPHASLAQRAGIMHAI